MARERQSRAAAAAVSEGDAAGSALPAVLASGSRDESFSLFHSVGKLLYGRSGAVDVEAVVAASAVQPLTILSFLQHNAVKQLTTDPSMQAIAQAEDAWSEAETASSRTRSLAFGDVTAADTQQQAEGRAAALLQSACRQHSPLPPSALPSSRAEPEQHVRLHRCQRRLPVSQRGETAAVCAAQLCCPDQLLLLCCL
jgi:hypothetical protein